MKKVLLAKEIKNLLTEKNSFLDRSDITIFTAATNDEVLSIHRKENTGLIVTQLDMPGIKTEELFTIIRDSEGLRDVSTIIICKDTLAHRERCKRCNANAVFTMPVDAALLHIKVQQFLNVAPRKSYRAALAVAIQGRFRDKPMPFWTENISSRGMLFKSGEPLAKGDGVFFSFYLPDGTHVSGYGEIARVDRPAKEPHAFLYGIKFTNVDPGVQSAIEAVVEKKEPYGS
jgi:CheY-like chemotaxis protein